MELSSDDEKTVSTTNNDISTTVHHAERPSTPDTQCSICLDVLINKCYSNSCGHLFCFECLKRWSNTEPNCPLCKKFFSHIYHTFTKQGVHETYNVPQHTQQIPVVFIRSFNIPSYVNSRITSIHQSIDQSNLRFRSISLQLPFFQPGPIINVLNSHNEGDQITDNSIETLSSFLMDQPSTSTGIQDALVRPMHKYNLRSRRLVSPTVNESSSTSVHVSKIDPGVKRRRPILDSSSSDGE